MKRKSIKAFVFFAIFAVAILMMSCDEWISDEILLVNRIDSGVTVDNAYIEYGDDYEFRDDADDSHLAPGESETFYISFYDSDKYGKIRVHITVNGFHYTSTGNIAENDWITVIYFPDDF